MNNSEKTIVVIGATGQQGGATARHLLAQGWRVRALTRDPQGAAAQALAAAGAEVVSGNMDDRASLDQAFAGAYGVFSVQNFWLPDVGAAGEVRQGKIVADAAKAAGVRHFVYTSVGGAERQTGLSHFDSKWQIEEYVRSLSLPATVLRPVFFMENLTSPMMGPRDGVLANALRPTTSLQMIAVEDIGYFAALAFARPQEFIGKAIELRRRLFDHAASCRNHDPRDRPAGAVCRSASGASSGVQPGDCRHVGLVQRPRLRGGYRRVTEAASRDAHL